VSPHDVLVLERIAEPRVPAGLRLLRVQKAGGDRRDEDDGYEREPHDGDSFAISSDTKPSSSSSEPSLT
jgi:hypothetical protein